MSSHICKTFKKDPRYNPETGARIKKHGTTYNTLCNRCGSPRRSRHSSRRSSRRSRHSRYSPSTRSISPLGRSKISRHSCREWVASKGSKYRENPLSGRMVHKKGEVARALDLLCSDRSYSKHSSYRKNISSPSGIFSRTDKSGIRRLLQSMPTQTQ